MLLLGGDPLAYPQQVLACQQSDQAASLAGDDRHAAGLGRDHAIGDVPDRFVGIGDDQVWVADRVADRALGRFPFAVSSAGKRARERGLARP